MPGDLSSQCLTVTGVFVSEGQAGLWLLSSLLSCNPHMTRITCISNGLFFPAAPDARVFVSCRTTSTWTRRHTSWWRTSWLTTKACRTRRATASVSNWIRRLRLRRASQAAANPQSLHVPCPSVLGGLLSGRAARGSPALDCGSQRNRNFWGFFLAG